MSALKTADVPDGWIDILKESDADLARGDTVPLSTILSGLQTTIKEIEAELATSSTSVTDDS